MDEQMIQEQPPETPSAEQSAEQDYAPEEEIETGGVEVPEGQEPEIAIDTSGEVNFRDDFFGNVPDTPEPEPEPEAPNYYSDDELQNTPFEQWDTKRLPDATRKYGEIIRAQLAQRQAYAQAQQQMASRPQTPPGYEVPKQYTPKELAEEAQKLAIKKLGLEDPEDFDEYEGEHKAALTMAMQELVQKNMAASQNYQRINGEYQQLQQFNAQLASRPDFKDFDNWLAGRMKSENLTPEQVSGALIQAVHQNNGNWGIVSQALGKWYQEYQASKQGRVNSRPRMQRPPTLESTRGNSFEGRRSVNLQDFGEMDLDRQAQALMKMGYA